MHVVWNIWKQGVTVQRNNSSFFYIFYNSDTDLYPLLNWNVIKDFAYS